MPHLGSQHGRVPGLFGRERWDAAGIGEGLTILDRALAVGQAGPFRIEAAISAVHSRAQRAEETDWQEIAALYALLEGMRPTPAVRVNRAFAVARSSGAVEGLALIDSPDMAGIALYPYVDLVRGTLLGELGRVDEAMAALGRAADRARNPREREQIRAKLRALEARAKGPKHGV